MEVSVPLISRENCIKLPRPYNLVSPGAICAGYKDGGKDACTGDSGGPLVSIDGNIHTQVGVTSYMSDSWPEQEPDVFSSVGSKTLCQFAKKWVCDEWKSMSADDYLCKESCSAGEEPPVCSSAFGKKKCNKTNSCSYHKKKKECLPAKSTQECTKYVGKKKSCLKKGCLWKVPGKAKCSGRWD